MNTFYIAKLGENVEVFMQFSWSSGQWEPTSSYKIGSTEEISVKGFSSLMLEKSIPNVSSISLYYFDNDKNIVGNKTINGNILNENIPEKIAYIAIELNFVSNQYNNSKLSFVRLRKINPYYKNLKKQYKKESNQVFFRESIEGNISLYGHDYEFINASSLEDILAFYIFKNEKLYVTAEFTKSDCAYDHFKHSVELKLKPKDQYKKILDSYNKSFDLIKLAVEKNTIQLTKRCVIQLYVQGSDVVTNYAGGTFWEDEVLEVIDDSEALLKKYYFSKGPKFAEISLSGFNYEINSAYRCIAGQNIWNGSSIAYSNGEKYRILCSIKFTKVASADYVSSGETVKLMSDGTSNGVYIQQGQPQTYYKYDTYRIEIYTGQNGTGQKIYQSEYVYGNDSDFILAQGSKLYNMIKVNQDNPYKDPEPSSFYLGENVIEYQIWGRLLCDVDKSADGSTELYDLPYDDFIAERANLRKCIGLTFSEGSNILVHFKQSQDTQEEPTPYGLSDYDEYFIPPIIYGSLAYRLYAYPLARSTWGNTSLWVGFEEHSSFSDSFGIEKWSKNFYKSILHKDCMEIGNVIKALLKKINPSIKFECSSEYSEFFYGSQYDTNGAKNLNVYITQKSNVLKGEYDQAAQKAEITFEQIMNMIKNCFRCYWFIDSDNRFRIEHIRFFMNGSSYTQSSTPYDLTNKYDKFNKKPILFSQSQVSYNKSDLTSRYEFAWADDVTEAMGGGFAIDVDSNYVEQNKVENINIDLFSSDIDLMIFAPDKFSQDGFALIITENGKIPIVYDEIYDSRNPLEPMRLFIQNYYASFIKLFENYLYDMPSTKLISSIDRDDSSPRYSALNIKNSIEHRFKFQTDDDLGLYESVKTEFGKGIIDDISIDIDTNLTQATVMYKPK